MTAMFAPKMLSCKFVRAGFWSVIASSCRTWSCLVLGMSGAKQSLATRLVAHHAYRHLPLGLRFRSASDQSGRQALAVYVAQYPSSAGRDALATCIRGQEASAATRRGGNRHKQDGEEDYRSP